MTKKILSDVVYISKVSPLSNEYIEMELRKNFKCILRWAVVEVDKNYLKLSVTFEV